MFDWVLKTPLNNELACNLNWLALFEFLYPNEAVEENVLRIFESKLEILENIIKNGSVSITFNDVKLLMEAINSSYCKPATKLSSAEKQVEKPFDLCYILADVIIGTAILVRVAYYVVFSLQLSVFLNVKQQKGI